MLNESLWFDYCMAGFTHYRVKSISFGTKSI